MKKKHQIESLNNKSSWNKAGKIFRKDEHRKWMSNLPKNLFSCLDDRLRLELKKSNISKKNIAHLACNNGREILSIKKMGAADCVGFDFSKEFISQANELNKKCESGCVFVESNITKIPPRYNDFFDIAIITVGTLVWIDNLEELFKTVNKILKKDGILIIEELHPLLFTLGSSKDTESSYFSKKTIADNDALHYLGDKYKKIGKFYMYQYTISDLLNSLIESNFRIKKFYESKSDISIAYKQYENKINFPMNYFLVAQKN